MKKINIHHIKLLGMGIGISAMLLLNACALTPEQQAKRDHEQKLYEQNLQILLANQCDKETADIMKKHFENQNNPNNINNQQNQDLRVKYIDKINEPMFQACYKMAWQNYISQQQLRQIQNRQYYDDWYYGWRPFPYWY